MSENLSAQTQPVTQVLRRYEAALNARDVDTIVSLYAEDGVFMAQHRAPSAGHTAIERAYREIFGMISLDIAFELDEVEVVSPTVAYARTRRDVVSEGNQELFLLTRASEAQGWQIGRYIFSTTQPPRG